MGRPRCQRRISRGIAVTVQDLTEVELNAAQSRFISNVSHELGTPLFNIKSYVETLHDLGDQLGPLNRGISASPMTGRSAHPTRQ